MARIQRPSREHASITSQFSKSRSRRKTTTRSNPAHQPIRILSSSLMLFVVTSQLFCKVPTAAAAAAVDIASSREEKGAADLYVASIAFLPEEEDLTIGESFVVVRWLQTTGSSSTPVVVQSNAGRIAWYCFVITVTLPTVICLFYFWCTRAMSFHRARMLLEGEGRWDATNRRGSSQGAMDGGVIDDDVLLRMEANVKAFSELENEKRARAIRHAVQDNVIVFTSEEIKENKTMKRDIRSENRQKAKLQEGAEKNEKERAQRDDSQVTNLQPAEAFNAEEHSRSRTSSEGSCASTGFCREMTCGICLEDFAVGDRVAHAPNSRCPHLFHEDCIVSWLLSQKGASCPFCRQPFVTIPLVDPSNTSVLSSEDTAT